MDARFTLSVIPGRAKGADPESILRTAAGYGFRVRSLTLAPRSDWQRSEV